MEHREPVVLPTPGQPTTVMAALAPRLVIDRTDDGHVRVSGVVADDAERRAILTALDTAFGADKVISNIGIDPSAAPAGWLSHLLDVARLVAANPRAALTLEGSKLTLGGPVSASDKRSLIDSIKTILGSGFTVEHREPVVLPTPGQPTTVTAAIAPWLVIDRTDDGHVRVSGVVADDAERRTILTALDTAFGADKVISNIGIDPSAAPAGWLSHLLDVARLVAANPRAALTLEGSKLTLGGPVSASDKRSLIDSIKTILGSGFTID